MSDANDNMENKSSGLSSLVGIESSLGGESKIDREKIYGQYADLPDSHPIIQAINREEGIENTTTLIDPDKPDETKIGDVIEKQESIIAKKKKLKKEKQQQESEKVSKEQKDIAKKLNNRIEEVNKQVHDLVKTLEIGVKAFVGAPHANVRITKAIRMSKSYTKALGDSIINLRKFDD